ncbi:MAG TPA: FAD-dependent monooxygenase [Solirubrobacteraceae bacterium]|jgi:flavin-dependent dehydrogenase
MSVRRFVLDPILLDAAREAGAEVLMSTNVIDLRREGDRVTGVTAVCDTEKRVLDANLVVGADGRNPSDPAARYEVPARVSRGSRGRFHGSRTGVPTGR